MSLTSLFDPCRSPGGDSTFLTPALAKEMPFLATSLLPVLSSTPAAAVQGSGTSAKDSASQSGVSIRKRRRLAASPGGLHWNSAGKNRLRGVAVYSQSQTTVTEEGFWLCSISPHGDVTSARHLASLLRKRPTDASEIRPNNLWLVPVTQNF